MGSQQGDALVRSVCASVAKSQGGTNAESTRLPAKSSTPPADMTERNYHQDDQLTPGEWSFDNRPISDGDDPEREDHGLCW